MSIKSMYRYIRHRPGSKRELKKDLDFCRKVNAGFYNTQLKLLGDINSMEAQVYNLTLYLKKVEERFPSVFKYLVSEFDGMPGYGFIPEDESD